MTARRGEAVDWGGVRVLVLGAAGFIGRWVARALEERGADVAAAVLSAADARDVLSRYAPRAETFEIDLRDDARLSELFGEVRPAITFNLAGYGVAATERDEETAHRINAVLPGRICERVRPVRHGDWRGQEMVHVGSAAEYGAISGDLREDSVPDPTTLYGRSKLAGTRRVTEVCEESGVRGLTARLFTVYGPGEHPGRLLPALREAARAGERLPLTAGTQRRDFTYVEEVAEGLLRLATSDARPGEVVNLATGRLTSVRRFAEVAAGVLGIRPDRLDFGALPGRPEEMEHDEVSNERLHRLTGWMPTVDIEEGIRRTRDFEEGAP